MRRALCVGIDQYSFGSLNGCVADATAMAAVLRKHDDGSPNFECRVLAAPANGKTDVVGRPTLKQAIGELFQGTPEVALLHFSGHGTYNNLDGYLVTQDSK